jgi:uncharacterized membrane protein
MAALTHVLTIAAFALSVMLRTPPLSFAGPVLALAAAALIYFQRNSAEPWAASHREHALRTLAFGYVIWTLAAALEFINGALVTVTLYMQIGVAIWVFIRAAIALVLAISHKPVANPHGWLV